MTPSRHAKVWSGNWNLTVFRKSPLMCLIDRFPSLAHQNYYRQGFCSIAKWWEQCVVSTIYIWWDACEAHTSPLFKFFVFPTTHSDYYPLALFNGSKYLQLNSDGWGKALNTLSSNHDIAWTYSSLGTFILVNFNQLTISLTKRHNAQSRPTLCVCVLPTSFFLIISQQGKTYI